MHGLFLWAVVVVAGVLWMSVWAWSSGLGELRALEASLPAASSTLQLRRELASPDLVADHFAYELQRLVEAVEAVGSALLSTHENRHSDLESPASLAAPEGSSDAGGGSRPSVAQLYRTRRRKSKFEGDEWRPPFHSGDAAADTARTLFNTLETLPKQQEQWTQNLTFATNTVDKILYQLRNWEPMQHEMADWNPPRLQDEPHGSSQGRKHNDHQKRLLIVGMSSVDRRQNYLLKTLESFFAAMGDSAEGVKIVVFNANVPPSGHRDVPLVRKKFWKDIEDQRLIIVERPSDVTYPELQDSTRLARRWGDALDRVQWRSKQVLDVAYLMGWAAEHCAPYPYFLMMEDDIIASRSFPTKIRQFVDGELYQTTDWTMASFYNPWPDVRDLDRLEPAKFFGVIGQLFRMRDLPAVVEFLRKNFDQSPLDWLFVDFLKKIGGHIVQHTPSLFQHEGRVSSLPGKEQSGRSVDFQP